MSKQMQLYFDTTKIEDKKELAKVKFRAGSQNDMVMEFMKKYPKVRFTPIQVWTKLLKKNKRILLTSVRRSMTTLSDLGELVKHDDKKRKETFGHVNCTWEYDPDYKPSIIAND